MPFATADELATRLGVDLTAAEQTDATALIARASKLVQRAAGQTIDREVDEVLTRRGIWDARLRLPERPVESVTSIEIDGVVVPTAEWYLEGDEVVRAAGWGGPGAEVEVTYTHGYAAADVPEVARTVCLEAVARVWVNPGSVRQEGYGSEQVSYERSDGLLLSEAERLAVALEFKRLTGSAPLR